MLVEHEAELTLTDHDDRTYKHLRKRSRSSLRGQFGVEAVGLSVDQAIQ